MTRKSSASIKIGLGLAGAFALGLWVSGNLGRVVTSVTPEAQAAGQGNTCSLKDLKGDWGYSYDVEIYGLGRFGGIGSQTCDKHGHCAGTDTVVMFGQRITLPFTSAYTIKPDCTGTGEIYFPDGIVVENTFVLVDGGDEIHFVGADADGQSKGIAKRR